MCEWKHLASPWCVYEGNEVADGCINGHKYVATVVHGVCMKGRT
jgi:hypothetical protein